MEVTNRLINIFNEYLCIDVVNKYSSVQLRNNIHGINIKDAVYYKFLYTDINETKQHSISYINCINNKNISRQAYDKKEANVPIEIYQLILKEINICLNNNIFDDKLIAVDGVYNNDNKRNVVLNLGLFNITDNIPVDIKFYGHQNRNKEVDVFINYINEDIDKFKNAIFVADRLYFNYKLLNFLDKNNLKYIIRIKGRGNNLDENKPLSKYLKNFSQIANIRKNSRVIKYKGTINKTVYGSKKKGIVKKKYIEVINDCLLVTNLPKNDKYSDEKLLDNYRSRWSIEVFFKHIKNNFKFKNMNEKNIYSYKKMYICELILTNIANLIEKYFWKKNKKDLVVKKKNKTETKCTHEINKSHLMRGIYDSLLYDIIYSKTNQKKVSNFFNNYIITIKNECDRSFPRNSKTPFTKWYVKGYSELTKYSKIINAIENKTIDKLNKNLKMIANKVMLIDKNK